MEILTKTTHSSREHIIGLILAGGQSRRMGLGIDKAFLSLAGRPLIQHVLDRLSPQVDQVVISANGDHERFSTLGLPVFSDLRRGFQGPLAGVETAFARTEAEWILSVAVDLPFIPLNLAEEMLGQREHSNPEKLMLATSAGRCHYVACLWPRMAMDTLANSLDNGQLCLHEWFQKYPHQTVNFTRHEGGLDPFFNINHPEDLQIAEHYCYEIKI